jgi:hypothetical protein
MRAHEFVHSQKGKNRVVAPWVGELISTAREERLKVKVPRESSRF